MLPLTPRNNEDSTINKAGRVAVVIVGVLFLLLGLGLAAGGGYLIALGGSWFYLPAGLAMAGVGLLLRKAWSVWLAWALLIVSAIWAFAEVGTDFWQLVPRSITFLVVALVATLAAPTLLRKNGTKALACKPAAVLSVVLAVVIVGIFATCSARTRRWSPAATRHR